MKTLNLSTESPIAQTPALPALPQGATSKTTASTPPQFCVETQQDERLLKVYCALDTPGLKHRLLCQFETEQPILSQAVYGLFPLLTAEQWFWVDVRLAFIWAVSKTWNPHVRVVTQSEVANTKEFIRQILGKKPISLKCLHQPRLPTLIFDMVTRGPEQVALTEQEREQVLLGLMVCIEALSRAAYLPPLDCVRKEAA